MGKVIRSRFWAWSFVAVSGAGLAFALGCQGDFDPVSLINNVRVLASRADKPYAKPGETVELELLAYDGRPNKTRPMQLYWIPFICKNPLNDAYFACFIPPGPGRPSPLIPALPVESLSSAADAGTDGGLRIPPGCPLDVLISLSAGADAGGPDLSQVQGRDISDCLPQGPKFSFQMPTDAVATHEPVPGADPYGLVVVFNIACAGRVQILGRDTGGGPQQVPLGCFDENGNALGPDDYVLGFTRVFAYTDRTNGNPAMSEFKFEGNNVLVDGGVPQPIEIDRCTTRLRRDCPKVKFDVTVPDNQQEGYREQNEDRKEQLWVTYYTTAGELAPEARLIVNARGQRSLKTEVEFQAPREPGPGVVFAVLRDSRGGTNWIQAPVFIR